MMDNKLTVDDLKIPYNKHNLDKNDVNRAMFHNIEKIKKRNMPMEAKLLLLEGVVDMAWALGSIDWNKRFELIGRFASHAD